MGKEIETTVRGPDGLAESHVFLEPGEIICRGGLKRRFKLAELRDIGVRGDWLSFLSDGEKYAINLGDRAAAWLDAIRNPRSRVQKLGAAAGMKVCLLGPAEIGVSDELAAATGDQPSTRLCANSNLVLFFADEPEELSRLKTIESKLAPAGAVWVLWPKGRRDFAHEHVVTAARAAGLVQTRSMGFSDARTGLRLVRPKGA